MIGRLAALVVAATAVSACAARLWLGPIAIDEYANVRVRIYRAGLQCRIEVIALTETIQTPITQCAAMPHRLRTDNP